MDQERTAAEAGGSKYQKAIARMGEFGRLFVEYEGCPRGPKGPMGQPAAEKDGIERWVCHMKPIEDVDGGVWRPVQEEALQALLRKASESERAGSLRRESMAKCKKCGEG